MPHWLRYSWERKLCRRLGGPQGRSRWVRKISPPLGFDPRTVQPVTSRCTEYTILANGFLHLEGKFLCLEDGDSRFLWCESQLLPGCVASRGGRQQSLYDKLLFAENICTFEWAGCRPWDNGDKRTRTVSWRADNCPWSNWTVTGM